VKKSGKLVLCAAAALLIIATGLGFMPLYEYTDDGSEKDCGSFFLRAADRCHGVEYQSAGVIFGVLVGLAVVTTIAGFIVGKSDKVERAAPGYPRLPDSQ